MNRYTGYLLIYFIRIRRQRR